MQPRGYNPVEIACNNFQKIFRIKLRAKYKLKAYKNQKSFTLTFIALKRFHAFSILRDVNLRINSR